MQHSDLISESMKKLAGHRGCQSDLRNHEQCVLAEGQSFFYGAHVNFRLSRTGYAFEKKHAEPFSRVEAMLH